MTFAASKTIVSELSNLLNEISTNPLRILVEKSIARFKWRWVVRKELKLAEEFGSEDIASFNLGVKRLFYTSSKIKNSHKMIVVY